jgi:hypothetical protein
LFKGDEMKEAHRLIINRLEIFLEERGKVEDGGWAKVGKNDLMDLSVIIRRIIEAKYEKDVDGFLPVEYMLVDRNKGRFLVPDMLNQVEYFDEDNLLSYLKSHAYLHRIANEGIRVVERSLEMEAEKDGNREVEKG